MAYKVFLSHSSKDREHVEALAERVRAISIETYIYEYDLQPGTNVAAKLKKNINDADAFIVLLTPNSQFSPYVHQEIGYAQGRRKLVIPLVEPGVSSDALAMLHGLEYLEFDPHNPEIAMAGFASFLSHQKTRKDDQETAMLLGLIAILIVVLIAATSE